MKPPGERLCFKCGKPGHAARFCTGKAQASIKTVNGKGGGPARVRDFEPLFKVDNGKKVGVDGFEIVTRGNRRPHVTLSDFWPQHVPDANPFAVLYEPDVQCANINPTRISSNQYEPNTPACAVRINAERKGGGG